MINSLVIWTVSPEQQSAVSIPRMPYNANSVLLSNVLLTKLENRTMFVAGLPERQLLGLNLENSHILPLPWLFKETGGTG